MEGFGVGFAIGGEDDEKRVTAAVRTQLMDARCDGFAYLTLSSPRPRVHRGRAARSGPAAAAQRIARIGGILSASRNMDYY